jgi:DNA-binding NtrC family response regulator
MPRTLLTFTGFHDPFSKGLVGEEEQAGPIITLAREIQFNRVILFSTPGTSTNSAATKDALGQLSYKTVVSIEELPIIDPTDYEAIRQALQASIEKIGVIDSETELFVSIASGTPQMHVTWLTLVASGHLRARILNTRPPRFVSKEKPLVSEIEVFPQPFPLERVDSRRAEVARAQAGTLGEPPPATLHGLGTQAREFRSQMRYAVAQPLSRPAPDMRQAAEALGIIGDHPVFVRILEKASLLAPTRYPVLILGETGTGKELLARFIHHLSGRPADRFVPLNCAAIPKDLVESTLFGHKKGSFTGAHEDRKGKFHAANGGTLFLDELGELPIEMQPKLLRVLQDGVVEPVGESKGQKVDVRIIAATNVEIEKAIESGRLREDLFYRLKVGICRLPPLRERRGDIPKIALSVLERVNASVRHPKRFSRDALAWLMDRPWHGNIRDLENTVEGAAILTAGPEIGIPQLELAGGDSTFVEPAPPFPEPSEGFSMPAFLTEVRKRLIGRALELTGGKQSSAARLLGITPQALNKHLNSHGLHKLRFRRA